MRSLAALETCVGLTYLLSVLIVARAAGTTMSGRPGCGPDWPEWLWEQPC